MSQISIQDISKSYFDKTILDGISFNVHSGDRIGLIGENGAGKTTLFKIISGKEKSDSGRVVVSGGVILGYLSQTDDFSDDEFVDALSNKELDDLEKKIRSSQKQIAKFDGDHESGEYKSLIQKYEKLISRFEALDGYSYERNLKEILNGLGLPQDALSLPFNSLSGGEKMRVNFAKILLKKPDVLLLDEPTNHLDVDAIVWLENTLSKYKGGIIVISHDRYFLDKVTNKTASLEDGKIYLSNGNYSSFIEQKQARIEYALKEKKRLEEELIRQTNIKQTMLSHRNMTGYHEREKMVAKLEDALSQSKSTLRNHQKSNLKLTFAKKEDKLSFDNLILSAKNIKKEFDSRVLFEDLNFDVYDDDKIFLVGPNGCGKSTLFSLFLGFTDNFEGNIRLKKNVNYAHMTQHVSFENEDMRIVDFCIEKFGLTEGKIRELLSGYGFYDTDIFKRISNLSGGERSRLYLALSLTENPDILFLDEPTNHLDIPSREVLENALINYNGAFIAISHDRYFISKCQKKIFGFVDKNIKEFDSYDNYLKFISSEAQDKSVEKRTAILKKSSGETKNRAKLRQEQAKTKKEIKELEDKIAFLENTIKSMEEGFNPETTIKEYEEYANISKELDNLLEKYVKITENT